MQWQNVKIYQQEANGLFSQFGIRISLNNEKHNLQAFIARR